VGWYLKKLRIIAWYCFAVKNQIPTKTERIDAKPQVRRLILQRSRRTALKYLPIFGCFLIPMQHKKCIFGSHFLPFDIASDSQILHIFLKTVKFKNCNGIFNPRYSENISIYYKSVMYWDYYRKNQPVKTCYMNDIYIGQFFQEYFAIKLSYESILLIFLDPIL